MNPRRVLIEEVRCIQLSARITTFVNGELDPDQLSRLQAHLEHCRSCGMKAAEYIRLINALASAAHHAHFPDDERAALTRLRTFAEAVPAGR